MIIQRDTAVDQGFAVPDIAGFGGTVANIAYFMVSQRQKVLHGFYGGCFAVADDLVYLIICRISVDSDNIPRILFDLIQKIIRIPP